MALGFGTRLFSARDSVGYMPCQTRLVWLLCNALSVVDLTFLTFPFAREHSLAYIHQRKRQKPLTRLLPLHHPKTIGLTDPSCSRTVPSADRYGCSGCSGFGCCFGSGCSDSDCSGFCFDSGCCSGYGSDFGSGS